MKARIQIQAQVVLKVVRSCLPLASELYSGHATQDEVHLAFELVGAGKLLGFQAAHLGLKSVGASLQYS